MSRTIRSNYYFAPLNRQVVYPDWYKDISHDCCPVRDKKTNALDSHSGEIICEIKAISPLICGSSDEANSKGDKIYKDKKDNKFKNQTILKFLEMNGCKIIQGSSIKGMISNLLDLISFGELKWYKPEQNKRNAQYAIMSNIQKAIEKEAKVQDRRYTKAFQSKVWKGWLVKTDEGYSINYTADSVKNQKKLTFEFESSYKQGRGRGKDQNDVIINFPDIQDCDSTLEINVKTIDDFFDAKSQSAQIFKDKKTNEKRKQKLKKSKGRLSKDSFYPFFFRLNDDRSLKDFDIEHDYVQIQDRRYAKAFQSKLWKGWLVKTDKGYCINYTTDSATNQKKLTFKFESRYRQGMGKGIDQNSVSINFPDIQDCDRTMEISVETIDDFFDAKSQSAQIFEEKKTNEIRKQKLEKSKERLSKDGEFYKVFFRLNEDGSLKDFDIEHDYLFYNRYTIKDLVNNHQEIDTTKADLGTCIFGDTSLKGRIHISHAVCVEDMPLGKYEPCRNVSYVTAGPKTSFYPMYIEQQALDEDNFFKTDEYQFYGSIHSRIAGRKYYPHKINTDPRTTKEVKNNNRKQTIEHNDPQYALLHPAGKGSRFHFKINYHNLRSVELGALMAALSFHGKADYTGQSDLTHQYYFKLGRARAKGLGTISIKVCQHEVMKVKDASTLSYELVADIKKMWEPHMLAFENYMNGKVDDDWRNSQQIKEWLALHYYPISKEHKAIYKALCRNWLGDIPIRSFSKVMENMEFLPRWSELLKRYYADKDYKDIVGLLSLDKDSD